MTEAVFVGGIGSAQPEFSRYILDMTQDLEDTMLRLQGFSKVSYVDTAEGKLKNRMIKVSDSAFSEESIVWMRGKLHEILHKGMLLSSLDDQEMYQEGRYISLGFIEELYHKSKKFNLSLDQYEELCQTHRNFLCTALRAGKRAGYRGFLRDTTSETNTRLIQNVTQDQQKRGLLSGLFGR